VAEGRQTHWIPTLQRDALEGLLDRRRYDTASRMAETRKTIKERDLMTTPVDGKQYRRKWFQRQGVYVLSLSAADT
jgi:hypothetical protein